MKYLNIVLLITCVFVISACSTNPGRSWLRTSAKLTDYNPQNYQGCTVGEYLKGEELQVRWWDCKDKASVSGGVDLNADGTPDFTYSATDVIGSSAAQIRADVEKAFSEAGIDIIPGVVDAVIKAVVPVP